ncbi:helix-turn-helix domain-containing protein [Haloferax denitrificans]|uniref:DNA binding protein n=1 Tax=Haloferax denitrificans ATCC 35960 TaxID=662478 RepID=M0JGS1_9EURY|nr:helix-turn-helix domain-containing protein [Haloferax denitrificans]EMA07528.1 DNA binding protein [Haloferax denitrificans ATCC 35960]
MAIVAEVLLKSESLPLVKLAQSLPNDEITLTQAVSLEDSRQLFMLSVPADAREAFDAAASDQPEVLDVLSVGQTPDGWFYQVIIDESSGLFDPQEIEEMEGVLMEATITGDGWLERKVFADYDALSSLRDRCQVAGVQFELINIASNPENPDERAQFGLTDRQYEAMAIAFSLGYYETPRAASTADVADELDISAPSVSDLLRRAERQLISQTLGLRNRLTVQAAQ